MKYKIEKIEGYSYYVVKMKANKRKSSSFLLLDFSKNYQIAYWILEKKVLHPRRVYNFRSYNEANILDSIQKMKFKFWIDQL